jgi:hypothetical protein
VQAKLSENILRILDAEDLDKPLDALDRAIREFPDAKIPKRFFGDKLRDISSAAPASKIRPKLTVASIGGIGLSALSHAGAAPALGTMLATASLAEASPRLSALTGRKVFGPGGMFGPKTPRDTVIERLKGFGAAAAGSAIDEAIARTITGRNKLE